MMFLTDSGISYSEGFFTLDNGHIINTFTNQSVGVFVRKIPSTSYLCISTKKKTPLWKRLLFGWRTGERSPFIPREKRAVPEKAVGTLADTFKQLEKDIENDKKTN